MRRVLITGGSGYLGRHLVPIIAADHEVCYTFFQNDPRHDSEGQRLDLRDALAVHRLVNTFRPHVIIHTAGSDRSPDSNHVIRSGAVHVARSAQAVEARLIHISTDVVFNGREAPYSEKALPAPIHDYGRSKTAAEASVRADGNHVIIRTSLIYGLDTMDHATAQAARALRSGKPLTLFTDQRRNPVSVDTLSHACLELSEMDYVGVLNVAGRQVMSRAEFGIRMLDWWGISERDTLSLGPADSGRWPRDCELDLNLATKLLSTPLWGVDEILERRQRTPSQA